MVTLKWLLILVITLVIPAMMSSVFCALMILVLLWMLKRFLLLLRLPSGPWGLPLIGSGFALDFGDLPDLLTRWHRRYGDIFSFSLPVHQDVIVVSSYELIHEVLVKRSSEFSGRIKSIRLDRLYDGTVNLGFSTDTLKWRVLKKAVNVCMKTYGEKLLVLEDIATSAVQDMVEKWRRQSPIIINPTNDISEVVYKTISSLVFHKEFSQREAEHWAEITRKFNMVGFADKAQYIELFPWLRYLPNADWKFLEDTHKETIDFINNQIKHRLEYFDGINAECTLDALLLYQRKYNQENKENHISDAEVAYIALSLMGAAELTTHGIIYSILAILAGHVDVAKKMQKEIEANIGNRPPKLSDRQKLPFVEAVIFETFRYWTQSAILVPHSATVDTNLAGFTVPKGTMIWPNVFNLTHDAQYWDSPWNFKPERFLDENGDVVPPDHMNRKRLLPFEAGRRVCVGQVLAMNRLFLIITSIVQNFDLSPAPGKNKPNHDCRRNFVGGMFTMPEDYEILISERQD